MEERAVAFDLEKAQADYDAGFASAYHNGLETGKSDRNREIVMNMFNKELTPEKISEYTGLSLDLVIEIQANLKR